MNFDINEGRRVRQWQILDVSPGSVIALLDGLCRGDLITARGLPKGAEPVGTFWDAQHERVGIYLDCDQFEPVRQHAHYPHINVEITNVSAQARILRGEPA